MIHVIWGSSSSYGGSTTSNFRLDLDDITQMKNPEKYDGIIKDRHVSIPGNFGLQWNESD